MKKFYKTAEAGTAPGGYMVRLDGKSIKTPLKNNIIVKSKALAEAMAEEWNAQTGKVNVHSMPINQLVNTMIDKSKGFDRDEMNKQLLEYALSDLVCYFAAYPEKLVKLHEKHWLPLIEWVNKEFSVELKHVSGIQYCGQSDKTAQGFKDVINNLNDADFTVLQFLTGLLGSFVISLAVLKDRVSDNEAYQAACVDEIYQLETWGEDDEARKRLNKIKSELEMIFKFKELVKAS